MDELKITDSKELLAICLNRQNVLDFINAVINVLPTNICSEAIVDIRIIEEEIDRLIELHQIKNLF